MRVFRHLEACNRFDPGRFLPLVLDGSRVGFVQADKASALARHGELFEVTDRAVEFTASGPRGQALTEALDEVSASLARRGLTPGQRRERFAITRHWGGEVLFELDRGAIPFFGTRSYGVHLNGLTEAGVWVGKRAAGKKVAPGKLDNLVAGGIPAGYDAFATVIKEAAEEASIPAELARQARPVGAIFYRMAVAEGARDDVLFVYDLDVPADFVPTPGDDECESFQVMTLDAVLARVAETDDFKFNVNLVLIDLAIRQGAIGPEHPDYLALAAALRGSLMRGP
jgi:8-oxo-dGTP pyrophosphatase MutT (NUDIX family)